MFYKMVVNQRLLLETTDYTEYTDVFSRVKTRLKTGYLWGTAKMNREVPLRRHFASV